MDEPTKPPPHHPIRWPIFVAAILATWAVQSLLSHNTRPREVPYSELLALVHDGKVDDVQLDAHAITATLKSKETVRAGRLPGIDETPVLGELREKGVRFAGHTETSSWIEQLVIAWILPMLLFYGLWTFLARRAGKAMGAGPMAFGRSRAKIYESTGEAVTFADVAGVDEAVTDLREVVDFLKQPERYARLGAHVPKGVLLVGPPGTGKTLLARAVAGEAQVPFFSITGSEFVEMFVGVGAARVRDLFEQAKSRAPCIVFIDELDAVGRTRGGLGVMATHDEREQTLNQLLAEIDGFDPSRGVILMSATNRPEVLDPALLRAGRFDRQILVDRPDLRGRAAILRVHARKLKVASSVDLDVIGRRTPGMAGADLANVVNEAALSAARRGSNTVEQNDFEEAIDRLQLGARKKSRIMTDEQKRRVAVHEAGHALVALSVPKADPVHRVTIIPRATGALGATLQLPTDERYLYTREELLDRICVLEGGRAAESLALGDISTGAEDDLARATELARQMVCRFGMSDRLADQTFGRPGNPFLDGGLALDLRDFSEESARTIDEEVRAILSAERARAVALLEKRRPQLERIVARLVAVETLDRHELERLVTAAPAAAA
jgi:cell division protease FtsH